MVMPPKEFVVRCLSSNFVEMDLGLDIVRTVIVYCFPVGVITIRFSVVKKEKPSFMDNGVAGTSVFTPSLVTRYLRIETTFFFRDFISLYGL